MPGQAPCPPFREVRGISSPAPVSRPLAPLPPRFVRSWECGELALSSLPLLSLCPRCTVVGYVAFRVRCRGFEIRCSPVLGVLGRACFDLLGVHCVIFLRLTVGFSRISLDCVVQFRSSFSLDFFRLSFCALETVIW